jgi:transposase InsO family protein
LICRFIEAMRADGHGVEPTCAALRRLGCRVAPRTYRAWRSGSPAGRTCSDAAIVDVLRGIMSGGSGGRARPEILYGRRKMTAWLARNGFDGISKHTVDRLMRQEGMRGLTRGRRTRTTVRARNDAVRAADLLNRRFRTAAPNQAWVADFTYVSAWCGFVYVAFAIDLFSRAIVGWSISTTKDVAFVESCLSMALWRRDHTGRPVTAGMIHHSDAGSQYTSIRFTETLALQGLSASIGSIGDAYDNAVAESVIGLFKNEAIAEGSPFRTGPMKTISDVEEITMNYTDWYNNDRLHGLLDNATPEELELAYYTAKTGSPPGDATNKKPA